MGVRSRGDVRSVPRPDSSRKFAGLGPGSNYLAFPWFCFVTALISGDSYCSISSSI